MKHPLVAVLLPLDQAKLIKGVLDALGKQSSPAIAAPCIAASDTIKSALTALDQVRGEG